MGFYGGGNPRSAVPWSPKRAKRLGQWGRLRQAFRLGWAVLREKRIWTDIPTPEHWRLSEVHLWLKRWESIAERRQMTPKEANAMLYEMRIVLGFEDDWADERLTVMS